MNTLKENILKLRDEGKSYTQIVETLNCARSTVCYYCGNEQRDKSRKRLSNGRSKLENKLKRAYERFNASHAEKKGRKYPSSFGFTFKEFKDKLLSQETRCYLTNEPINLNDSQSYAIDHIVPRSRGGTNTLDNVGLTTKRANNAKNDMTLEEFLVFCQLVLENQGYEVKKMHR